MKLKYNQNGVTETIPLSTRKKQGKRLAIHHNDQNHYAPVVPTDDPKASNLPVGVNGEIFAVQAQEPPEVTAVNVAPSSVAVMQGQSATATVSAVGNDAITGLSYGLSGAPTWITISDDLILIQPSDNDLGFANVQVYASDTGSDAMSAAILRAEAKLRPIIKSLSIIPPAVTVQQGQSAIAGISAVANEAVTGLSYNLNGASSWVNLNGDSIIAAPTDNDLGTNVLDVIAYDINSSASAATQFTATAALRPIISSVSVNPPTVAAAQGESTTATISAVANEAVTGLSYSLDGNPDWMNLSGSVILMTPTENDSGSAAVTVTAQDTGSTAQAQTVFNADAVVKLQEIQLQNYNSITPWNTNQTIADLYVPLPTGVSKLNFSLVNPEHWNNGSTMDSVPSFSCRNKYIDTGTLTYISSGATASLMGEYDVTVQAATEDGKSVTTKVVPVKLKKGIIQYEWMKVDNHNIVKASSGNGTIKAIMNLIPYNNGTTVYLKGYFPKNATVNFTVTRGWSSLGTSVYYPKSKQTTVASPSTPALYNISIPGNEYFDDFNVSIGFPNLSQVNADYIEQQVTLV